MNKLRHLVPFFNQTPQLALVLLMTFALVLLANLVVQAQGTNTPSLLNEISAAFSGNHLVGRVQLDGTADLYAGSLHDSGPITLSATSNGSSQMQLQLSSSGTRSESQQGSGLDTTCQWSGADGVEHEILADNCIKPALWFLPAFSLQPSLLNSNFQAADLGTGTVGSGTNIFRHLQTQVAFPNLSDLVAATDIEQQSTTDIGVDPESLLPSVLAYSLRADNGPPASIAIEVHFSDYRVMDGAQIPFHIQRYVNGSLQLDILINSVQIN